MANPFDSLTFASARTERASNPFDSLSFNSPSIEARGNPFDSLSFGGASAEPERGLIGTILHETALDLKGAATVAAAPIGSLLNTFGADVPITLEDIDARDIRGAGAVLAMIASGGAASLLGRAGIGGATALSRAATTAGTEAVGGAIYGALARDPDESLVESVTENALLFGGIGAGASVAKSAYKATVGATIASMRAANARAKVGEMAARFVDEQTAREFAGVTLANTENGARAAIRRNSDGKVVLSVFQTRGAQAKFALPEVPEGHVRLWRAEDKVRPDWVTPERLADPRDHVGRHFTSDRGYAEEFLTNGGNRPQGARHLKYVDVPREALTRPGGAADEFILSAEFAKKARPVEPPKSAPNARTRVLESKKFTTMGEALSHARASGFVDEIGPYRKRLLERADVLDESTRAAVAEHPEGITGVLGKIHLDDYASWRESATLMKEAESEMVALGAETLAPTNAFGEIALDESQRRAIAHAAGVQLASKVSNADLVRTAVKKGVVDLNTLQAGVGERDFLRELFINSRLPEGNVVMLSNSADTFFSGLLTPFTVGKIHREVAPLIEGGISRSARMRESQSRSLDVLAQFETSVTHQNARLGVEIIDRSIDSLPDEVTDVAQRVVMARDIALAEARSTGNAQIASFVEGVQPLLDDYLARAVEQGALKEGLAGYFPIINSGSWELKVVRDGKVSFEGFHNSQDEALGVLNSLKASDPTIKSATVSPKTFKFEGDSGVGLDPKQLSAVTKALRNASEVDISWNEASEMVKEFAYLKRTPLKGAAPLKHRTLGIRDFSEDPFDALRIYIGTMERMLAFRDFERTAQPILDAIPANKPQLRRWAEQYVDDLLGRPHTSEKVFQNAMNWMSEMSGGKLPVPERALKQYSAGLRRWVGFSRLGGVWSGVVNSTQIAVNVYPKLGAQFTSKGLEVLNPKKFNEVARFFETAHFDLGLITPFTEAGGTASHEKVRTLFKKAGFEFAQGNVARGSKATLETVERAALFTFNGTEKVMRLATAWGAYNKGLSEGMSKELALDYAKKIERETMFDYSLANTPQALRGPVRGVLFQFKQFFVNEMEFIASLSPKEAARFGTALWALGGASVLFNLPGSDVVDAASGAMMDQKISERLKIAPESRFAKGLVFGLPGAIANVDLSDSVGVGSLADITRSLFGPGVRDAKNASAFFINAGRDVVSSGRISPETMNIALHQLLPTAIRNARVGAAVVGSGEVRNSYTGKLVYRPEDRLLAGMRQFVGAPSIDMTQERAMDEVTTRVRERFVKARTSFAKEAATALRDGDAHEAQKVIEEARASGYDLDSQLLNYWTRELGRTGAERREKRTPKQLREEYAAFFDSTT